MLQIQTVLSEQFSDLRSPEDIRKDWKKTAMWSSVKVPAVRALEHLSQEDWHWNWQETVMTILEKDFPVENWLFASRKVWNLNQMRTLSSEMLLFTELQVVKYL